MAEFNPAYTGKPVTDPKPTFTFGTVQVGTFADDPAPSADEMEFPRREGPMFVEDDREPESAPEPSPEPAAAPQAQPAMPVPDAAAAFSQAIRQIRAEEQQARQAQLMAQETAKAWAPPEIPDDIEEMLADPEKTKEVLTNLRDHTRGVAAAVMAQVAPLHQELHSLRIREAKNSWTQARRQLIQDGMPAAEADAMAGQIEGALQQANNPEVYWKVWQDPDALVNAARMLKAKVPGGGRRPASIGVGGGSNSGDGSASGSKHKAILQVERLLGTKLSKDRVEQFNRETGRG